MTDSSTAITALRDITDERREDGPLVRQVQVVPEFDCLDRCAYGKDTCKPDTGGWHGIGTRRIIWSVAVLGRGAVSLKLSAPIYTENALLRGDAQLQASIAEWSPIGPLHLYYSTRPECMSNQSPQICPLIGGECWVDVTYMAADDGWDRFVEGGTPAVWAWLAETRLPDTLGLDSGSPGGPA